MSCALAAGWPFTISFRAGGKPHFPVPWADDDTISALVTPAVLAELPQEQGFRIRRRGDSTAEAVQWFRQALQESTPRSGGVESGAVCTGRAGASARM